MTDRKKPGVAFWATVVLVVLVVGYPLSFGPACWIASRLNFSGPMIPRTYPLAMRFWAKGPPQLTRAVQWYAALGSARGWDFNIYMESPLQNPDGSTVMRLRCRWSKCP